MGRNIYQCYELLQAGMDELAGVPGYVFERLAQISHSEIPGRQWRSDVLQTAGAQGAYIHRNVLHEYTQPPWTLCEGDVEANLRALGRSCKQPHPVAEQLRILVKDCRGISSP